MGTRAAALVGQPAKPLQRPYRHGTTSIAGSGRRPGQGRGPGGTDVDGAGRGPEPTTRNR